MTVIEGPFFGLGGYQNPAIINVHERLPYPFPEAGTPLTKQDPQDHAAAVQMTEAGDIVVT